MQGSNLQPCGYEPPALPVAPMVRGGAPYRVFAGCSPRTRSPSHYGQQGVCIAKRSLPTLHAFLGALPGFTGTASGHGSKPGSAAAAYGPRHLRRLNSPSAENLGGRCRGRTCFLTAIAAMLRASICLVCPAGISPGTRYSGCDRASVFPRAAALRAAASLTLIVLPDA